jgi:hypothetical protein
MEFGTELKIFRERKSLGKAPADGSEKLAGLLYELQNYKDVYHSS